MASNRSTVALDRSATYSMPYLHPNVNLGPVERTLSALAGGALVFLGLRRGVLRGAALTTTGTALLVRGARGHCPLYQAFGISTAARAPQVSIPAKQGVRVEASILVNREASELYAFWRNVENLPTVMSHLISVAETTGNRSHWVAQGPLDSMVEWEAEVINEVEGERIGWRSLEGSQIDVAGSVHFEELPGSLGTTVTKVTVVLKYNPPAGRVGAAIARLLGDDPQAKIEEDLLRFRQLMEADEAPATEGQPSERQLELGR